MVFDPDNHEVTPDRYPLIPNGEYLMVVDKIEKGQTPNTDFLKMKIRIEEAYDEANEGSNNKFFFMTYWMSEKAIRFYYDMCKKCGAGMHDETRPREVDGTPGYMDVWLNRPFVGKLSGKYDDKGYQQYRIYNPRPLNEKEIDNWGELSIGSDDQDIPF